MIFLACALAYFFGLWLTQLVRRGKTNYRGWR